MDDELLLNNRLGGEPLDLSDDTITEATLRAAMRHAFKESLNAWQYSAAARLQLAQQARIYQKMIIDLAVSGG